MKNSIKAEKNWWLRHACSG